MSTSPRLNADEIFRTVEPRNDLAGLADDGLRRRFAALVQAFNDHGRLSKANIAAARVQIEERLRERLKLERDLRDNPAIEQEAITRPIFVVGYSRTGTTVMHSLLGEDPHNRMPRFWEALSFSPPPGLDASQGTAAIAKAERECRAWIDAVPGILSAHPYWDQGALTPIEDEEIFSVDFNTAYPSHFYRVPFSPLDLKASDPIDAYRFLRRFLQYRQWRMPARRWVCKGVMHQFYLDKLWEIFPDALCVWTHRDPVEFVASTLGIYKLVYDPITGGIDCRDVARGTVQAIRGGYDYILGQSWIDDPRIVHVRFKDFIADPTATIGRIYEQAKLPFTSEHETAIHHWLRTNRADRHGKFTYSYDSFGISGDEVRRLFADYIDRFALA